ncbi:MAG: cold shock domain-containing protein [Alphaproteobacteria bacterium]|nr:cold shock domain-containing protein [Alphaproteobacteria bacterium]
MTNFDKRSDGQQRVRALLKWYNPTKGFGFVQLGDDRPDAFLHASVLNAAGHRDAPDGATVVCDVEQGPRGLQVAAVYEIDASTASESAPRGGDGGGFGGRDRGGYGNRGDRGGDRGGWRDRGDRDRDRGGYGDYGGGNGGGDAAVSVDGTVKFYDAAKGYGFVVPDGGGRDVFVSGRTLQRHGIQSLTPDQRVRMSTRMGQKGPMAETVELI